MPWRRATSAAIASRRGFAPHVTAYWLMSPRMASRRGLLDRVGRGKVGKPLRQIHGAVTLGEPGHLADDRLGEQGGFLGRARPHARDQRVSGSILSRSLADVRP